MPSTTSERLAVKRSLRDMEQISAANKACASFSNKSICLVAVFDDQRRIKVHVETKEPLLLARMEGKTVVCSIVLDDQQLHASPDESKMYIDAVSITGTYADDAVIVDSSVEEYCEEIDNGEASTSTVEVTPVELDMDEDFLSQPLLAMQQSQQLQQQQVQMVNTDEVLRHQQQRLLLLRHAAKCPHQDNLCPVTPHCAGMKRLWKHIAECKDQKCMVPHCVSSRYVLSHYHRCKDVRCPVCGPVREAIPRSHEKQKQMQALKQGHQAALKQQQQQMLSDNVSWE